MAAQDDPDAGLLDVLQKDGFAAQKPAPKPKVEPKKVEPKKVEAPVLSEEEQKLIAATTEALNQLIEQGKDVASELKEAEDMNLPRLAQRGRRKSKDLEEQAMDLMGSQLEKVFKMMDIDGSGNLD